MGWDFDMIIDTGGDEPACVESGLNYTYNVSPMFYDALPLKDGIRGLDGLTGGEAMAALEKGLQAMWGNPEKYLAMNPENGWGDYEGAMNLLRELLSWAKRHPKAVFEVH